MFNVAYPSGHAGITMDLVLFYYNYYRFTPLIMFCALRSVTTDEIVTMYITYHKP